MIYLQLDELGSGMAFALVRVHADELELHVLLEEARQHSCYLCGRRQSENLDARHCYMLASLPVVYVYRWR